MRLWTAYCGYKSSFTSMVRVARSRRPASPWWNVRLTWTTSLTTSPFSLVPNPLRRSRTGMQSSTAGRTRASSFRTLLRAWAWIYLLFRSFGSSPSKPPANRILQKRSGRQDQSDRFTGAVKPNMRSAKCLRISSRGASFGTVTVVLPPRRQFDRGLADDDKPTIPIGNKRLLVECLQVLNPGGGLSGRFSL